MVAQALQRSLVWLTPPAARGADQAAAAARAAELMHRATREMLRAGVVAGPDDDLAARALRLRHDLQREAESLLALADDDEGDVK